jgi:hypothetical protein
MAQIELWKGRIGNSMIPQTCSQIRETIKDAPHQENVLRM